MHREETHFGAESDDRQHKRQTHRCLRQLGRGTDQRVERQVVGLTQGCGAHVVHEDGRQQSDTQPRRGDQHILPRRLGCPLSVVQRHQQCGDNGGDLDGDPQQREAIDQGAQIIDHANALSPR